MKIKNTFWLQCFAFALLLLSSHLKYSFAHNAENLTFSAFGWVPPLICLFFSMKATSLLILALLSAKFFGFKVLVTMGLPTIAAVLVWRSFLDLDIRNQMFMQVIVPLCCILAFITHPVGHQSPSYTLYWLVPITVFFIRNFLTGGFKIISVAAASTFVCHAVGSVIWLYSLPSTPQFWLALIPIVFWERLVMMTGMTVMYFAGNYMLAWNVADPTTQAILLTRQVVRRYLMWRV